MMNVIVPRLPTATRRTVATFPFCVLRHRALVDDRTGDGEVSSASRRVRARLRALERFCRAECDRPANSRSGQRGQRCRSGGDAKARESDNRFLPVHRKLLCSPRHHTVRLDDHPSRVDALHTSGRTAEGGNYVRCTGTVPAQLQALRLGGSPLGVHAAGNGEGVSLCGCPLTRNGKGKAHVAASGRAAANVASHVTCKFCQARLVGAAC
jgi:hypothetical protein